MQDLYFPPVKISIDKCGFLAVFVGAFQQAFHSLPFEPFADAPARDFDPKSVYPLGQINRSSSNKLVILESRETHFKGNWIQSLAAGFLIGIFERGCIACAGV